MSEEQLFQTAKEFRERAYAPYSKFLVGAAVKGESGEIYGGCNVENASYGLTICAERNAIFKAVAAGERKILEIAVITDSKDTSVPCGACAQVLLEFGEEAHVYLFGVNGESEECKARDLMPFFNRGDVFKNNLDKLK